MKVLNSMDILIWKMNYQDYWEWVRKISINNYVFCSEQKAPEDFISVWEQKATRTMNKENNFKATEHLFIYKDGKAST